MAFLALLIGVVLIVAAVRNTHGNLMSALLVDVPGFAVWGAAIFAVAVIGFIPGLKPVSRGLLWLVVLVLILKNYKTILSGFQTTWQGAVGQAASGQKSGGFSGGGGSFGGGGSSGSWINTALNLGQSLAASDNSGGGSSVNGMDAAQVSV